MKNERNSITPNEVNKYIYCPYQWYYERLYGRKEIYELRKERNKKFNLNDKTLSNFKKGTKFHEAYYIKFELYKFVKKILAIGFLLVIVYYLSGVKV
ncbi:MAG: PD-(D/E)XK nuclease family protein [Clostridiales bacterium]|jgi:hypothetical protein|nr:PD-(D/E)XK nuclease family protein [Clostridiales bacterium]